MNTEAEIHRLLALAEPLRLLADDDLAKGPLTGIVDEINALRAEQNKPRQVAAVIEGADHDPEAETIKAELAREPVKLPARRPGRPKKA